MKLISFKVSKADAVLVKKIVKRAAKEKITDKVFDAQWLEMDLKACHANGNRMDFKKLLDADAFNFAHDIYGIHRHLCRQEGKNGGKLMNFFVPRCSR